MTRFKTSKYMGDTQKEEEEEIKVLFMNRRIYHMDMRHIANRKIKIPHHNLQFFLGFDVSCSTFNTETPPP
jgi:predicted type IV restriction endonuclease